MAQEDIQQRLIEQEMKESYVDYAMSVIIARALPDIRDGLKPVHRRILFTMHKMGLTHGKAYKKCARITGTVMGRYHPHGDMAIYDSLVRLAQDFSLRYPLVDGQGNFGCFTGDTKIKLLDGTSKSFKELCETYKEGEIFHVYSVNKEGKIVVGEGRNPRITKKDGQIIEVTLDTGEKIRCTPNHRFLLKDLTYKKAKDLTSEDSLMPGYFKDSKEMIQLAKEYNHYVTNIKYLNYTADVYDITVNEHHNFLLECGVFVHNSIDGFRAASQRYTEARLKKIAEEMLLDIDKKTVQFVPNYDNTEREPSVLPSKLPNLLLNGSTGIAVGMATNIPPHNISEVLDASIAVIDNPSVEISELLKHIKGPDFPTGGIISGITGLREAYEKGKGKIIVKAKTAVEDHKIIVTEIPYMVNKTMLIENIVELVKEGTVEGISDIRDESDREGLRIVLELKKNADPQLVLNQLHAQSMLKTTFGIILLAVHENQPIIFNLKDALKHHISHRKEVVTKRTQFELQKAEDRNHIVLGLITALDQIDPVVKLIKEADNVDIARQGLMHQYQLSELQANAILDMRLQKLTSLETSKLKQEHEDLKKRILEMKDILASEQKIYGIIRQEFVELKEKYADKRKTEIADGEEIIEDEDLIKEEKVVVTITHSGYIKKLPIETYKQQKRGGQGIIGAETSEDNDIIRSVFTTSNLNYLLFFTNQGKVHWLKAYEVPTASRYAKGKAIVNLVRLAEGEKVSTILPVAKFNDQEFITMVTKKGVIKKTSLSEFANPRQGGIRAMNVLEGDELVASELTPGTLDIVIATKKGIASRFNEADVRAMGRTATGVRGIKLEQGDEVIGMQTSTQGTTLLTIKEDGYGKRTTLDEYRQIHRGGKGIINIKTEGTDDNVVGILMVNDDDEIIIMSQKGIVIRTAVKDVSIIGRNTQGVRLMKTKEGDKVMTVAKVVKNENA